MKRNLLAKLILAASLVLPWLAAATGCHDRDDRGWRRDWDDRREDRRVYDHDFDRDDRYRRDRD